MPRECLSDVALGQRAIACAVRRSEKLLHSLQGFKGFKGQRLRAGKRQAWTPIKGLQGFEGF